MTKTSKRPATKADKQKATHEFKARLRAMNQWPGVVSVSRLLGRGLREVNALIDAGKLKPVQLPTGERRFDPTKVETLRLKLALQDTPPEATTPIGVLLEAVIQANAQQAATVEVAKKLDHILGEICTGIVGIQKHLSSKTAPHDARAVLYLLDSKGERCAYVQVEPQRQYFHVFWTREDGRHTLRIQNFGNVPMVIYSIEVDQKLQLDQPSAQSIIDIERDPKPKARETVEHKPHAINIRVQALA